MKENTIKATKPAGEVDEAQIEKWKQQYGDRIVSITSEDEKHIAYFRKPDRTIMKFLATKAGNFIEFNEGLFENCWLAGSEEFKTNEDLYLGTCEQLDLLVKFSAVVLKKN